MPCVGGVCSRKPSKKPMSKPVVAPKPKAAVKPKSTYKPKGRAQKLADARYSWAISQGRDSSGIKKAAQQMAKSGLDVTQHPHYRAQKAEPVKATAKVMAKPTKMASVKPIKVAKKPVKTSSRAKLTMVMNPAINIPAKAPVKQPIRPKPGQGPIVPAPKIKGK